MIKGGKKEKDMHLFDRKIGSLSKDDIESIFARSIPENDSLEFKKDLSAKGQAKDEWYKGNCKIGKRAREKILSEIVALANTYGGYLILGIEETSEHPPRPAKVNPIPACCLLKDKFLQMANDCIEPVLNNLRATAIEYDDNGYGLVVFEIPRSTTSPHRLSLTGNCYARRNESCVIMNMREIQDLAVNTNRSQFEALWAAQFSYNGHQVNGGVVVLDAGRVFGGDAQYYYYGYYEIIGENLRAVITATCYNGEPGTAFGDNASEYVVSATGKYVGNQIIGLVQREGFPAALQLVLTKKESLR